MAKSFSLFNVTIAISKQISLKKHWYSHDNSSYIFLLSFSHVFIGSTTFKIACIQKIAKTSGFWN